MMKNYTDLTSGDEHMPKSSPSKPVKIPLRKRKISKHST